jgi:hypothetical protein
MLIQAVIIVWLTMTTLCLFPAWMWTGIGGRIRDGRLNWQRTILWIVITWVMLLVLWPRFLSQVIAKMRGTLK